MRDDVHEASAGVWRRTIEGGALALLLATLPGIVGWTIYDLADEYDHGWEKLSRLGSALMSSPMPVIVVVGVLTVTVPRALLPGPAGTPSLVAREALIVGGVDALALVVLGSLGVIGFFAGNSELSSDQQLGLVLASASGIFVASIAGLLCVVGLRRLPRGSAPEPGRRVIDA